MGASWTGDRAGYSLRILIVSPYFPPYPGGLEYHVLNLSRGLAERGHEVTVVTSGARTTFMDGVKVSSHGSLFKPLNNPITPGMLFSLLSRRADIIHCHGYFNFSSNLSFLAGKARRIPVVCTFHGYTLFFRIFSRFMQGLYDNTVGSLMLKQFSAIIALSNSEREILERLGAPVDRIKIITNGVDVAKFFSRNEWNQRKNIVLFVGRLIPRKGVKYLLMAMPKILRDKPSAKLVIVGEGPEKRELLKICDELEIGNSVSFLGHVSDKELERLYNSAGVLALPSLLEAVPLVLLEAMASGCPVVATDVNGIGEIVRNRETGLLVKPREPDELAQAVIEVLNREEKTMKMIRKAREIVKERFSLSHMVEEINNLYVSSLSEAF